MIEVGQITRTEVDHVVVAYGFDLRTNEIDTKLIANPNRGRQHKFVAYRLANDPRDRVTAREQMYVLGELAEESAKYDDE